MYNKKLIREIVYQANIDIKDTVLELGAGIRCFDNRVKSKSWKGIGSRKRFYIC
ncbi:hypothetical protein QKW52_18470 [Bacillus sonorensis]|nr:hypothetical protein [Bacillus sonorensis]